MISSSKEKKIRLKPHQEEGVSWMISRENDDFVKGGILADDPGLGKTYQSLEVITRNIKEKTLIIVPKSIINQWKQSIEEILINFKVYIHHDKTRKSNDEISSLDFKICLSTHGSCHNLEFILWDRIIIDEGHVIRNKRTKLYHIMNSLKKDNTINWILTGTPIQNSQKDIKTLLKFIGVEDELSPSVIKKYVKRRPKNILYTNGLLTDYKIINHLIVIDNEIEQEIYKNIERDTMDNIMIAEEQQNFECILEMILRLRQCCIHPFLALSDIAHKNNGKIQDRYIFSQDKISSKIKYLVKDIISTKENCLVFCHFRKEMELIRYFLSLTGLKSEIYDGSLNNTERDNILNKFNNKELVQYKKLNLKNKKFTIYENKVRILLIQIKAGGVGLNLQKFSNVFIVSPDWNPSNEIQAIARSHRLGQKNLVKVHKYTLQLNQKWEKNIQDIEKTIDQRILEKQKFKRQTMVEILSDNTLEFKESVKENRNQELFQMLDI